MLQRSILRKKSLSFKDLKGFIPESKTSSVEKKVAEQNKEKDRIKNFAASKVRTIAVCDTCGASCCIYSKYAIGVKNGPTEMQLDRVSKFLENGFVCGMDIPGNSGFYIRVFIGCGDFIES